MFMRAILYHQSHGDNEHACVHRSTVMMLLAIMHPEGTRQRKKDQTGAGRL